MKRALTVAIVASWVAMITLLIRKQAAPPGLDGARLPAAATTERDEWFGVYRDGTKVGHAHRVTARSPDGYTLYEDSVVALAVLGVPQTLHTTLTASTDERFALRDFRFTLVSPATVFSAHGATDGTRLGVTYGPRGQSAELSIPLAEPIYLPSTLRPRVLAGDLTPGTQYTVPVFSPLTLQNEPLTVTVEGRETLVGPAGPVAVVRLAEEHQGVRAHAWLAEDGGVLREEAALGFTLEREPPERARAGVSERAPLDLTVASRIVLRDPIADPRHVERLTLRVGGPAASHVPDDPPRQRHDGDLLTVVREAPPTSAPGGAPAPAGYAAAAPFIESDDPAVAAQAQAVTAGAVDRAAAARRLVAWVAEHVEKAPTVSVPSAREVLASRRGDCNEHAVLLTAMARAVGIPARVVAGAVYADDAFYYHAWVELWLGRWISADSVFDQMPADATHVKLVEGGLERHVALAGMIGRLQFALVEPAR